MSLKTDLHPTLSPCSKSSAGTESYHCDLPTPAEVVQSSEITWTYKTKMESRVKRMQSV